MIPKGLKVGDTFEDGGVLHRVTKIVDVGYESEVINGDIVAKEVKKEVKTDLSSEPYDLSSVPYAQLKKMCAEKGLDATGSKTDLIARLEG